MAEPPPAPPKIPESDTSVSQLQPNGSDSIPECNVPARSGDIVTPPGHSKMVEPPSVPPKIPESDPSVSQQQPNGSSSIPERNVPASSEDVVTHQQLDNINSIPEHDVLARSNDSVTPAELVEPSPAPEERPARDTSVLQQQSNGSNSTTGRNVPAGSEDIVTHQQPNSSNSMTERNVPAHSEDSDAAQQSNGSVSIPERTILGRSEDSVSQQPSNGSNSIRERSVPARREDIVTPAALTPLTSQDDSPRALNEETALPECSGALPSSGHGIEALRSRDVDTTTSTPPPHGHSTPSLVAGVESLGLEDEPVNANRRTSPPPEPQPSNSSRPSSRRRSALPNPVSRHEVDDEHPPDFKFYQHDFQHSFRLSKDLARRIENALSSSHLHLDETSTIHGLYRLAQQASNYRGLKSWKIGFVGDTGSGKSSLINALLDVKDLARSSSKGAACTCNATEYHFHDSPTYAVEVVYFPKDRLLDQFRELVQTYKQYHSMKAETAEERAEKCALEKFSDVAWRTLRAAFHNQPSLTEMYLQQEDEQTLLENIRSWIDQCAPEGYHLDGHRTATHRESVSDLEACRNLLERAASKSSSSNPAASWPYIERVNVYLRANILSRGLVLVDLPGLRDTNSAREMITERYIVNCDEVFAIANIGRATTDAGVKAVIDLARRTKRAYVGIVCTRSDDIVPEEAERDWEGSVKRTLTMLKRDVEECRTRLQSIDAELCDELDKEDELNLYRQRRATQAELNNTAYQLQRHMVTTRNVEVTAELRLLYRPIVEHVFCVSKLTYWDHREKDSAAALPWLSLSGIIELRRHCLGLVAHHQLRDATTFMRDVLPHLVLMIDLWVLSGSSQIAAETRIRIREASREVEQVLQRELGNVLSSSNQIFHTLAIRFDDVIQGRFRLDDRRAWQVEANNAVSEWITWPRATFTAFCKKYGDHSTRWAGHRCWNQEVIERMVRDLSEPWEQLCNQTRTIFDQREATVDQGFAQALHPLQAIDLPHAQREEFDSLQTLIKTLYQRRDLLRSETLGIAREYERALAQLGNADVLSPIRTSLIGQYMEPTYGVTSRDSGHKVEIWQKGAIANAVNNQNLFESIRNEMNARFDRLALELQERVQQANVQHLSDVRKALDTLRNENAVDEAERNPQFRERLRGLVRVAQRELRDIVAVVRAATEGSNGDQAS